MLSKLALSSERAAEMLYVQDRRVWSSWDSEKASLGMYYLSRSLRMCRRIGKGEGHDDEEDEKLYSRYCWSLAWRILSITLLAREMSAIVLSLEHSLALPFFGIGMNTDFQSCGHCWVFQICWHIECSTFTVSSFSISPIRNWLQTCKQSLLVVLCWWGFIVACYLALLW